jgi:hypothetical protein
MRLPLADGKVAINEDTMLILRSREICSIDMINRLFKVLEDAEKLARFTLADDVVTDAVLPRRNKV